MVLHLTGERTVPGVPQENYWFRRHEAAYRWVAGEFGSRLRGATVVEAGAGEGYGAEALRGAGARAVLALDYDGPSCEHVRAHYPQVLPVRANLGYLPLADESADVVVALQVVEHLWELRGFLRDVRRVLRSGGLLVLTTPNRLTFSPGLGREQRPTNPFHVEEFDAEQLTQRVERRGFVDVRTRGLHHGARVRSWERDHGPLPEAQIAAALGAPADPAVAALVGSVTVADFVVSEHDVDHSLDLVLTAGRP